MAKKKGPDLMETNLADRHGELIPVTAEQKEQLTAFVREIVTLRNDLWDHQREMENILGQDFDGMGKATDAIDPLLDPEMVDWDTVLEFFSHTVREVSNAGSGAA